MNKPIQEIYAIGDKLPPEVLMDIDNRITDWLISGGNDNDSYVWKQVCGAICEGVNCMVSAARHEPIHVLFDTFTVKWHWSESELIKFRQLWNDGDHIKDITKAFKTNKRSIALVVMEQAKLGEINPRAGGLFGN